MQYLTNITLTFSGEVDTSKLDEVILNALKAHVEEVGITPEDSEEMATSIQVGKIKYIYVETPTKYVLTDGAINGEYIHPKVFDEEMTDYRIIEVETEIYSLERWIGEGSHSHSNVMLMRQDLQMLQNIEDEFVLSSISTNEYLYQHSENFEEECENILEVSRSIRVVD